MATTFPSQSYRAGWATVRLFAVASVFCAIQCCMLSPAIGQGESPEAPAAAEGSRGFTGLASGLGNTVRGIFGSKESSGESAAAASKTTTKRELGILKPGAFRNGFAKQIKANTVPDPDADFSVQGEPTKEAEDAVSPPSIGERVAQQPAREPFSKTTKPLTKPTNTSAANTQKPATDPPSLVGSGVRSSGQPATSAPALNRFNAAPNKLAELPKPSADVSRYSQQTFAPQPLPEVVTPSQVLSKPTRPETNAFVSEKIAVDRKAPSQANNFSGDVLNKRIENPTTTTRKSPSTSSNAISVSKGAESLEPLLDNLDEGAVGSVPSLGALPADEPLKSSTDETLQPISKKPVPASTRRDPSATAVNSYKPTGQSTSNGVNQSGVDTQQVDPQYTNKQPAPTQGYSRPSQSTANSGFTVPPRSSPAIGYDLPSSNYSVTSKQSVSRDSTGSTASGTTKTNTPNTTPSSLPGRTDARATSGNSGLAGTGADSNARLDMSIPKVRLFVAGESAMQVAKPSPYEVIVKNEGTESLSGVIVSMTIPSGVTASSFVSTAGEFESEKDEQGNDTVLWHVTDLGPSQSRIFRLNLEAAKPEHFAMDMEWTVLPQAGQIQIAVEQPQLTLALEGPSEVLWGKPELYRLRVRNPGNAAVKDVHVKLVAESFGSNDSNIGDIPAGGEKVVEVELTFQQMGKIAITGNAVSKVQSLEARSNIDVSVNQIKLESEWNAPEQQYLGSIDAYEVTLHNRSNLAGDQVTCLVMIPEGLTAVRIPDGASTVGNEIRWKLPSIAANESKTFQIEFQANEATQAKLRFDAQSAGNGTTTATATTSVDPIVDLKLTVVDPVAPAPVGREVQYDLVILNRGSRPARAVSVVAQFSNGIEPIRAEGIMGKLVPGQVIFDPIETIGPGQQITLRVVAQASEAGVHRFRAELQCEDGETQLIEEESTRYLATSRSDSTKPTIRR